MGTADAGATVNFVLPGTAVINMIPTTSLIYVNIYKHNQHPMTSRECNKGEYSARFVTYITAFNCNIMQSSMQSDIR